MKKLLFSLASLAVMGCVYKAHAQVKLGATAGAPDGSAILEMESTSKGLLLPRMTTAQMNAIPNPVAGLQVYNTEVNCLYYYNGTAWKSACAANINASFAGSSLACTGALSGDYVATYAVTAGNTKTVAINVLTPGDYTAATDQQNGIVFSSNGTLATTGTNNIVLTANGTPALAGTYTYTVSLGGQTCTFNVTFANPPSTIDDGSLSCMTGTAATGVYTEGLATVSSVHTKSIQVTPTTAGYYNYTTNTVNGITFSASGVFTAGQIGTPQTINLAANGTPLSAGAFTYSISGTDINSSCSFSVTAIGGRGYLIARPSTTAVSSGTDVNWTNLSNKEITVSGANITLKANKVYRLRGALMSASGAGVHGIYGFVDVTNTYLSTGTIGEFGDRNQSLANIEQSIASAVYAVGTSDVTIKLRAITIQGGTMNLGTLGSYLEITEITGSNYLHAKPSTSSISAAGQDISWTSLANNGVTVSGATITLAANKKYMLRGTVATATSGTYSTFAFVDASNVEIVNGNRGEAVPKDVGYNNSGQQVATAYITTGGSPVTVKLRTTGYTGGAATINQDRTFLEVTEIPTGYDFLQAKPVGGNITNNSSIAYTSLANSGVTLSGSDITLKAGKVYLLQTGLMNLSDNYLSYQFVNSSNVALSTTSIGEAVAANAGYENSNNTMSTAIVKVGNTDIVVRVRSSTAGTALVQAPNSYLQILQIQ